jgi:hypothetical protein
MDIQLLLGRAQKVLLVCRCWDICSNKHTVVHQTCLDCGYLTCHTLPGYGVNYFTQLMGEDIVLTLQDTDFKPDSLGAHLIPAGSGKCEAADSMNGSINVGSNGGSDAKSDAGSDAGRDGG